MVEATNLPPQHLHHDKKDLQSLKMSTWILSFFIKICVGTSVNLQIIPNPCSPPRSGEPLTIQKLHLNSEETQKRLPKTHRNLLQHHTSD